MVELSFAHKRIDILMLGHKFDMQALQEFVLNK